MAVIKDVAKLAAVSAGTVSKYLNNPDSLKHDTRARVKQAVEVLQYKPNLLARSMRTRKTNTISVIVPDITNPFFAEAYNAIRLTAVQNGFITILYTIEDNMDDLEKYLERIMLQQTDGVIICFIDEVEEVEKFIEENESHIPMVHISWDMSNIRSNSVVIDVFDGIYTATRHIISLGHHNIAYIGAHENNVVSKEKYNGYARAMRDAGYTINPEFIFYGNYNLQSGYRAARKFMVHIDRPTGIVAANDILAIGSIKYLLQRKIRVPDDVAVIGLDNILLSVIYEPALSTVSLHIQQMGSEAVRLLLNKIKRPASKNRQVILKTELIVRNSTDKTMPVEFEL